MREGEVEKERKDARKQVTGSERVTVYRVMNETTCM